MVSFELIALRRLFQRKTDYLTFRAVMEQPIPDVRRYRADVPEALAAVLARALDRDPNNRFQSARQYGTAILDALAPLGRPWSQGEISDFIRHEFADDIHKRNIQVQTAVSRNASGIRSTMPLIAHDDGPNTQVDDEDDDEFPSVDSTISEAPIAFRATRPPQDGREFAGNTGTAGTPQPFGNETSTSGVAIQPLPAMSMPYAQTLPAKSSRSVVWPLLAIAMAGIAGGALFLVWKQMDQRQQAPAVVNITSSSANEPPDQPAAPKPPEVAAVDSGSADEPPPPPPDKPVRDRHSAKPSPPRGNPYTTALQAHRPGINKCAQDHGAPPAGVKVVIVVSTNGRAKTISLEPTGLDGTPLGACIKNVLSATAFPKDKDEKQVSVTFKTS